MLIEAPTIDRDELVAMLGHYGIQATRLAFLPLGADGHNYCAEDGDHRWFVSVKRVMPHHELDADAQGLERAYRATRRLREEAGVEFLSPAVARADGRYASVCSGRPVVVQRWLDGGTREPVTEAESAVIVALVMRLHAATVVVPGLDLPPETFDTAFVPVLEAALRRSLDGDVVGPQSSWLRETIAVERADIMETLARFRTGREAVLARGRRGWVVTHGEPHWANIIWSPDGPVLVDCGSLRLAPPERDLVPLEIEGEEELTHLYRRRWVLSEIAECADRLSRPHDDDAEDRRAREQLLQWLGWTG